jgi:hypothetical protein
MRRGYRATRVLHALVVPLFACCSSQSSGGGAPDALGTGGILSTGGSSEPSTGGSGGQDTGGSGGQGTGGSAHPSGAWPTPNPYSWDGSWTPADADFPLAGLYDDVYFDGHADSSRRATPILPPGDWDWGGQPNLSNWNNFSQNVGSFGLLTDSRSRAFGWRLAGKPADATVFSGAAEYFLGSSGADILYLGPQGDISSIGGNLGDGPDVLVTATSHSLDYRTGSSLTGSNHDNDLLVLGCRSRPDGSFGIVTTTFHTGPGADWVFVRDLDRSAIDLGNGDGGKTTVVDPKDGDDLVVLHGNTHDFRVFGGGGSDTFVWYVDENVQTSTWLGPNFFGGGGDDLAVWSDPGVDRLVMVVPATTTVVTTTPTPNGGLLVQPTSGAHVEDDPTQSDPYARYCVECAGPNGQRTVRMEYNSADGRVKTGYFGASSIEELQIGIDANARVYRVDTVTGKATLDLTLLPFVPPNMPACADVPRLVGL